MSLHNKLKQVKGKGEEKTIALRMQKGKVDLLDKLANHYGTNISTLVREMIDESIRKLQLELIVLDESNGVEIKEEGESRLITYLPAVTELLAPDLTVNNLSDKDFCSDMEAFNHYYIEDNRLSVEHGFDLSSGGIDLITKKAFEFTRSKK